MTRNAALASVCLATLLCAAPAQAAVVVIGAGWAYDCYITAKTNVDLDKGLIACNTALQQENLTNRERAGTMVNRGVIEMGLHRPDAAMADYNNGIAIQPDLGDAYVDRGAALINAKRYDEALIDINKGIGFGVTYPHLGYFNRAVAEEMLGQWKESYYDFKKVLELEPKFTQASDQLKNFTVTTIRKP